MSSFPLADASGYKSTTVDFKITKCGPVKLDILYPESTKGSTRTVVLHYHGGFLLVGNRYAFLPHWLVRGCISRGWIFVTPDYRLLPEATAQASLQDAIDAYRWVLDTLPTELGCEVGSVLMAGSSAGGYLALATAANVTKQPSALLLVYGMLDATFSRYLTRGSNIFGRPVVDTSTTIANFPMTKPGDARPTVSDYPIPPDTSVDPRFALMGALHIDALFPDYMTGIEGLGHSILAQGVDSIPEEQRNLFPLSFGELAKLPPVMLVHGKNDSAVPMDLSTRAADALGKAGVEVLTELPEDAEHGFDARAGNVDVESPAGERVIAYTSLRNALKFLDDCASPRVS